MKQKFIIIFICLVFLVPLFACNIDEQSEIQNINAQYNEVVALFFDKSTVATRFEYDTKENTWTAYITNYNLTIDDTKNLGADDVLGKYTFYAHTLNNALYQPARDIFNKSKLKNKKCDIFIHLLDKDEKVCFSSENGITCYSALHKTIVN